MTRSMFARRKRLEALCAGTPAGEWYVPTVRRYAPSGYDVTIYRGPYDEPVDLVVEADWSPGCCVSWDCPGEPAGWEVGDVWFLRRGTWRKVRTLSNRDVRQIEAELGAN